LAWFNTATLRYGQRKSILEFAAARSVPVCQEPLYCFGLRKFPMMPAMSEDEIGEIKDALKDALGVSPLFY
jgi:hypothetical protein